MSQEKIASPAVSASGVVLSGLNSASPAASPKKSKVASVRSASVAVPVSPALAAAIAASRASVAAASKKSSTKAVGASPAALASVHSALKSGVKRKRAAAAAPKAASALKSGVKRKRAAAAAPKAASAASASPGKYEYMLLDPNTSDPKIQAADKRPKAANGKVGRDRFQVARKLASKAYKLHYKSLGVTTFKMVIRKTHADPTLPRSYGVYDVKVVKKMGNVSFTKGGKTITTLFQAIPKSVRGDEKTKMIARFLRDAVASPKKAAAAAASLSRASMAPKAASA